MVRAYFELGMLLNPRFFLNGEVETVFFLKIVFPFRRQPLSFCNLNACILCRHDPRTETYLEQKKNKTHPFYLFFRFALCANTCIY